MDMDEFMKQVELDELADKAESNAFLTPREYAKIRHMQPQLVYYHLRNKHIEIELCRCGRKIIDVAKVDAFFNKLRGDKAEVRIEHDD